MKRIPFCFPKHLVLAAALLLVFVAPLAQAAPYAYVTNNSSNNVSVIDTATDSVAATISVGSLPIGVAVSPNGSRVYVANDGSSDVSVIDTSNNTVTATISVGTFSDPVGVAVSPDGSRVYVTNNQTNTVSVIDAATNTVTATVPVGLAPYGVAVSPDGSRVYVAQDGTNYISVIDATTNTVTATVTMGGATPGFGVAVSPDGSRVYVTNQNNNTVSVIDTTTNMVEATVPVGTAPLGVAVSPDGSRVYVGNRGTISSGTGTVSVIDTATNTVTATVPLSGRPICVAVSPDGSRVYVGNNSGAFSVIDTANDTVTATVGIVGRPYPLGDFVGPGALIATNSSGSGGAGTQISGTVPTLTNNTSPGCSTTDALVQSPAKGTVTFAASTGAFTYTPSSGTYSGPDAFTWRGQAPGCAAANAPKTSVSNTATVSLTIDPLLMGLNNFVVAPGASGQATFSLTGSTPFSHTLASDNATVLPPAGLTISPATCGTLGSLNCALGVTPATAQGTASVTVTAIDAYGDPVKKTVLVTVADTPPTATGTSFSTPVGTAHSGQLHANDPNSGQTLAYSIVTQPSHGTVSITNASTGAYTYTPMAGYIGSDSFAFKVYDGYKYSNTASVSVSVTDQPPLAQNASYSVTLNHSFSGHLKATASSSSLTLSYTIVSQPIDGVVSLDAKTGQFTYVPNHNYTGTDSFTFKANDGTLDSNTATVTLKVAPGSLTQSSGGGAFGSWGLAMLAGLTLLVALGRKPILSPQQHFSTKPDKR